jgi:hypothetical protein
MFQPGAASAQGRGSGDGNEPLNASLLQALEALLPQGSLRIPPMIEEFIPIPGACGQPDSRCLLS